MSIWRPWQALARLLNAGRYRAKGYPAPMEWGFREKLVKYAENGPDLPRRDGAEYSVWGTSLLLVAVVPKTAANTVPKTDHEGVGGVTAIPETWHKNGNCGCLELVTNNPVEFMLFSTWCLPMDCKSMLENRCFTAGGSNDVKHYLNMSMTYFSYLSKIGTIYQRLMLRTPLASVSRGQAKAYTPPAAKVDLAKKPVVLKAVMAQISRPEYLAKIPRYTEDSGPEDGDELCRFPPAECQQRSIDVKARDKMTVDEILNNSVFTSPYYGDIMCSFCCSMIGTRDISDVICHLVNRHKKLVKSWFSCPVCISTTITDWNGFGQSWVRVPRFAFPRSCVPAFFCFRHAGLRFFLKHVGTQNAKK